MNDAQVEAIADAIGREFDTLREAVDKARGYYERGNYKLALIALEGEIETLRNLLEMEETE